MSDATSRKIVVLGLMTKMPVAGVVWQNLHYLIGLQRLGYDVHYVEAHAGTPSMLMREKSDDGAALAAAFIDSALRPFGFGDKWAYVALHDDGRCYGMSPARLDRLYDSAELIFNLHGGTRPHGKLAETGRLVYLETDPVQLQVELANEVEETLAFLEPHCAFFTFAECLGRESCLLPVTDRFDFQPTRQPVVCDLWQTGEEPSSDAFTTIGNWRQRWREVHFGGEIYTWSKENEFLKVIDLPRRTDQPLELSLGSYQPADRECLEEWGWRVRPAMALSTDPDVYRDYIRGSRGEFTVAKDQNVRFRSGWFSDRSATYLAAGRPVVTQDTGFGEVLPTGEGLFAFKDSAEAVAAIDAINSDYQRHSRAAREIAVESFGSMRVLHDLLGRIGAPASGERGIAMSSARAPREPAAPPVMPFANELQIEPLSRWPTVLPEDTVQRMEVRQLPDPAPERSERPEASLVIPTCDNFVFLRLCVESVLADPAAGRYEVIVVDNGSSDRTTEYLRELAQRRPAVRPIELGRNHGFAAATNRGIAEARSDRFVLLNDDVIVPPGMLARLIAYLEDPEIGIVGASTNRSGNEAEVPAEYGTFGELREFATEFAQREPDELLDVRTVTLFCAAMRRDVHERCGDLDERFGLGMFEDDDYAVRVREAGYRVAIARDVFVHHFGQVSVGKLAATEEYGELFHSNRRRFERKWGVRWLPHARRRNEEYESFVQQLREVVAATVPEGATVAVVSRGDDDMVEVPGASGRHFPHDEEGAYVGYHPADSEAAIEALEGARRAGAEYLVLPRHSFWWLGRYTEFAELLADRFTLAASVDDVCMIFRLERNEGIRSELSPVGGGSRLEDD